MSTKNRTEAEPLNKPNKLVPLWLSSAHRSRAAWRNIQAAIHDALPATVVLLDRDGYIVAVNKAWRLFADDNGLRVRGYGLGQNYLDVCDRVQGDEAADARSASAGIRAVLAGADTEYSLEYPCHSASEQRWILMKVTPISDEGISGAVVMHIDITTHKKDGLKLLESMQRMESVVNSAMDAVVASDGNGKIMFVNPEAEKMFGYTAEELRGQPLEMLLPSGVRPTHRDEFMKVGAKTGTVYQQARQVLGVRKGGEEFPVEASLSGSAVHGTQFVTAILRDSSDRIKSERQIARLGRIQSVVTEINSLHGRVQNQEELLQEACRIAVETGGFLLATVAVVKPGSEDFQVFSSSRKADSYCGAVRAIISTSDGKPSALASRVMHEKTTLLFPELKTDLRLQCGAELAATGAASMALLPLMADAEAFGVIGLFADAGELFTNDGVQHLEVIARDIEIAMNHQIKADRLNYIASHDLLTGLANRSLFLTQMGLCSGTDDAPGPGLAVCVMDLERFRNVNADLGRKAGDALLKLLAGWLLATIGDTKRLARIGPDQFAVAVPNVSDQAHVKTLIEKTTTSLKRHPFDLNGAIFHASVKVGVAFFPGDGNDPETVLKNAESALKKAKSKGDQYLSYTSDIADAVTGRVALETRLRRAIEGQQFVLHYQPKLNLRTGNVVGAEALIRWNDPEMGLVPPGRFVPVLEETGMIREVGRWALGRALEDYSRWRSAGQAVRIAVNVSPLQLRDRGFVDDLAEIIRSHPNAADALKLEITESLLMEDVRHSATCLTAIHDMGIAIDIDDFGTGYSSLSYLSKFPVDCLKIDRSFIVEMTDSSKALALVASIIELGHSLNLQVVAEGVDTEEQFRQLRLLNCDEIQGFLFSKAIPADEFQTKYLAPVAAP